MLNLKKLLTKILTELTLVRISRSYSGITLPTHGYAKFTSFADLGVPTSYYFVCARIKGWQGTSVYSVVTSSAGTDFYITGTQGTITSLTVDFYFAKKVL